MCPNKAMTRSSVVPVAALTVVWSYCLFRTANGGIFKEKEYSNTLQIIGFVPIIAPQEVYAAGNYKERVKFLCGKSVASVEIKMDFDTYHNVDSAGKIALTKDMLLTAAKRIKAKVDFDYDRFRDDLKSLQ